MEKINETSRAVRVFIKGQGNYCIAPKNKRAVDVIMIESNRSKFGFKIKEIWFADAPYDIKGYDVVYFNACKEKKDLIGFERTDNTTLTIDLTQDINTIWQNMSKSSCRYAINRAKRDRTLIYHVPIDYKPFWKLNKAFRSKKNIRGMNNTILSLKPHCKLFVAYFNDEVVAGQLYIFDDNTIRLTINASDGISNANRLLIWEAINWAKNREIKSFDLGGYNPEIYPTVASFKKSFGGVVTPYYNYVKIYSKLLKSLKVII